MTTRQELAAKQLARAKEAAAAGFTSEARRKDAIQDISRAYGNIRDLVQDQVWNVIRGNQAAEARHFDVGLPYELHNLRPRHSAYILEVAPDQAQAIAEIEALLALRNEFKAQPLVVKVKAPVVIQPGDKTQLRGNCQCCGRDQAVNHTVAKHGYEVKDRGHGGYFRGVCSGHAYEPMQVKRDITDVVIAGCRADAERLDERAAGLRSGALVPDTVQGRYNAEKREYDRLPFAEGTPWQKRDAVETEVYRCESRARAARAAADDLEKLVNRVHGQPLRVVKV